MHVEVDVLIFDRPPQPLDKDVVEASSPAIHADPDVVIEKNLGKGFAGELGALISVEYLRSPMLQCHLQGLHAERGMQGIGEGPGEHVAAIPVDDCDQVKEAMRHGNIGDIC